MVRATWMADRQSPGLLGCVGGSEWHRHDGQIMGCLASEGKVSRPEERRWKGSDGSAGFRCTGRCPRAGCRGLVKTAPYGWVVCLKNIPPMGKGRLKDEPI